MEIEAAFLVPEMVTSTPESFIELLSSDGTTDPDAEYTGLISYSSIDSFH